MASRIFFTLSIIAATFACGVVIDLVRADYRDPMSFLGFIMVFFFYLVPSTMLVGVFLALRKAVQSNTLPTPDSTELAARKAADRKTGWWLILSGVAVVIILPIMLVMLSIIFRTGVIYMAVSSLAEGRLSIFTLPVVPVGIGMIISGVLLRR